MFAVIEIYLSKLVLQARIQNCFDALLTRKYQKLYFEWFWVCCIISWFSQKLKMCLGLMILHFKALKQDFKMRCFMSLKRFFFWRKLRKHDEIATKIEIIIQLLLLFMAKVLQLPKEFSQEIYKRFLLLQKVRLIRTWKRAYKF